ncbi:hypothetical protein [Leucobacter soli]|uniref:hypothetical protein n=1 Tax=Leucobacter soli TaxID=2812850 RepID=UPI0036124927
MSLAPVAAVSSASDPDRPLAEAVNEHDLTRDPYPIFDRLRQEAPLHWYEPLGAYLVTRWEDCERVLLHPERFTGLEGGLGRARGDRVFGTPTILASNGELHRASGGPSTDPCAPGWSGTTSSP